MDGPLDTPPIRSQHRLLFLHHGPRLLRDDARCRRLPGRLGGAGRPQVLQELLPLLPDQPGHPERRRRSRAEGVEQLLRMVQSSSQVIHWRIHCSFDPLRG